MTDEENIASLLEWLDGLADYHDGPTAERAWASAIRQLMRERKLADFEIRLLKTALAGEPTHPPAPS
jgi:hypothetical protein